MRTRRRVISGGLATTFVVSPFCPGSVWAQGSGSLHILVPSVPGSGWDKLARAIEAAVKADGATQTVEVENVAGSGGLAGLEKFVQARKGQGNTLMVGANSIMNAAIRNSPQSLAALVPIARLAGEFEVVVVPAQSPYRAMSDLTAALKADPRKVVFAGGALGGTDHIITGMIGRAVGIEAKKMNFVSFDGDDAVLAALASGKAAVAVAGWGDFSDKIKSGELRALAITAEKRQSGVEVATLKEQGVDVEYFSWRGVFAAPGSSADQQNSLIDLIDRMAKNPAWLDALKKFGLLALHLSGGDFAKFFAGQTSNTTAILKELGLAG